MVASELIYEAWKNTKKPIKYVTCNEKGNIKEREIDFADPLKNEEFEDDYRGICNLCGKRTEGGIPAKKMFSSNYMDWPIHKEPRATHVCRGCAFCLGMNPNGRIALFRYAIVAEKSLHVCNKKQFRDFLLSPPDPPFVMIMPISQKKHLFSKSKLSYSRENYFCNLEETTVQVNAGIREIIGEIEALRGVGFTKMDIEKEKIPSSIIKKYGFSKIGSLMSMIHDLNCNAMSGLALEVAQKMKEEDAICYLDLTPITR